MEPIQWNQYKRGEKIFWIYAALDILYFGLNGFGKGGIEILCTVIWQIILLNFIYYGYSWVLYCMMAAGGILFAKGCFELLLLVFEGDWMIYAYSPSRLVITGLKSVIDYSCAMKSRFRKSGNQITGRRKSSLASLLA